MALPILIALASAGVAVLSWCSVGLIRVLATRWNIMDFPNDRSSHRLPVPLCGGIALVLINIAVWIAFTLFHGGISVHHMLVLVSSATLIAAISLIDDLFDVSYKLRFIVQAAAATLFIVGYESFQTVNIPVVGPIYLGILGIVLTFIWFVGMTNAYNFMDGIDGMVGGQTVAAGIGWVILGVLTDHLLFTAVGACLAASSLGFLAHNWHPARIFMGDVGATFLGFTLAALTVIAARNDPRLALAGALLVWPSIFDTGFTVVRRLRLGHSIFAGHRSFLFHRLIHVGWSHSAASMLYIPLPIIGAVLATTWEYGSRWLHALVILSIATVCISLWAVVRHQESTREALEPVAEAMRLGAGVVTVRDNLEHSQAS